MDNFSNDEALLEPLFSLGRVQYVLPSSLESLACSSNILYLCVSSQELRTGPRLIRIDLSKPEEDEYIDVPNVQSPPTSRGTFSQHQLFCDPSGRHVLISSGAGETFYFYQGWSNDGHTRSAKVLPKLRGLHITAVSWNPHSTSTSTGVSTREMLLGTSDGRIIETYLDGEIDNFRPFSRNQYERYVRPICSLPDSPAQVKGLYFQIWSSASRGKPSVVIIASTNSCLYQFVSEVGKTKGSEGTVNLFDELLNTYRDSVPKTLELPGEIPFSELHVWNPHKGGRQSLAWLTGPGIYRGKLVFSSQGHGDGVIEEAQLLPYPASQGPSASGSDHPTVNAEFPISMALSEFHLLLLYRTRLRVIRNLDDKLVYEEEMDLSQGESVVGLVSDVTRKTYWCYSNQSIFEISIVEEDRNLWNVYLERQSYDEALKLAKTSTQRDTILSKKADKLYRQAKYIQAAEVYATSSKNFEEVSLKFFDVNDHDALRNYVTCKVGHLKKTDKMQRLALSMWLIEMFLSKINQLEDETASEIILERNQNLKAESTLLQEDLKEFLGNQKENLIVSAVMELISYHGRTDLLLHFASITDQMGKVVAYYVENEQWTQALEVFKIQNNEELFYKYAPILIRQIPEQTVDQLLRYDLDYARILPCLLPTGQVPALVNKQICRYLTYQIYHGRSQYTPLHNALISLYATSPDPDETDLVEFLSVSADDPLSAFTPAYDLDYALRVCKQNHRMRSAIHVYAAMGFFQDSVHLALESGDIHLAVTYAEKPENDRLLKKKLWLSIARHIIRERHDIKTAVNFLERTDLLKIEDILPFFPDFVFIDDFKDEICKALENCSSNIESLKNEMDVSEQNAEVIRQDISDLSNRFAVIGVNERCEVCKMPVVARQFYVFPCQHAFHGDCLISMITQYLPKHELRRIVELQTQIASETGMRSFQDQNNRNVTSKRITAAAGEGLTELRRLVLPDALMDFVGSGLMNTVRGGKQSPRRKDGSPSTSDVTGQPSPEGLEAKQSKVQKLKEDLDLLVASSCPFCDSSVASLDKPFVLPGDDEL